MTDQELREKLIEILASCLSDNDVRSRVKEVFDAFKEAGYVSKEEIEKLEVIGDEELWQLVKPNGYFAVGHDSFEGSKIVAQAQLQDVKDTLLCKKG